MNNLITGALIGSLIAGGAGVYSLAANSTKPTYRLAAIDQGPIVAVVTATGTINPITTVIVGSQLSGQVVEILANYNDEVKADQILARLNSDQIRHKLDAAKADIAQMKATKTMQEVEVAQAERNYQRQNSATFIRCHERSNFRRCPQQIRIRQISVGCN